MVISAFHLSEKLRCGKNQRTNLQQSKKGNLMIIDKLENAALYQDFHKGFHEAFTFLQNITNEPFTIGKHIIDLDNIFAINNEYKTKGRNDSKIEAHRKYIDIQYIVEGSELIGYCPLRKQTHMLFTETT